MSERESSVADKVMGRELASGEFRRQQSRFRDWVGVDPASGREGAFPVEAGRYHLYVALACPWSHRAAIVRELAGLQEAVGVSYLSPYRDERGWAFTGERFEDGPGGEYADRLNGWAFLSEGYLATEPSFDERVTVPVLWDCETGRIVNNESSDIVRMFHGRQSLGALGDPPDLYPVALRKQIDALCERVYDTVNNGVYRTGFARRQDAYERAFTEVFEALDWLEELLGRQRYLARRRPDGARAPAFATLAALSRLAH